MQTQLFLPQKGADQTSPLIPGVPLIAQGNIDATPFAEFVQQLAKGPTPNLAEVDVTFEGKDVAQSDESDEEIGLLTTVSEDEDSNIHLPSKDAENLKIPADHQDTSVSSKLLETSHPNDSGHDARVGGLKTDNGFSDQDHLLDFTKHDTEQGMIDPKSTIQNLQSLPTMVPIATQENLGKSGENTLPIPTVATQVPATKQPDFVAVRSPVELVLLSQKIPENLDGKGMLEKAASNSQETEAAPLQKNPQNHHFLLSKLSETINQLGQPIPAKLQATSTRTEHPQLGPQSDVTDQHPAPQTNKLAQYTIQTVPAAVLNDGKTLDTKTLLDRTKDVFELRSDTLIETRLTTHVTQPHTVNRSDFASPVTRQIVDAIQARVTAEKVIEVSLNPAELGRLKLSLTPAENGLIINIMAERAETIEMIRRNLTDLEQAFSDMGHKNITFSFDNDGGFADQDGQEDPETHSDRIDWSDQTTTKPAPSIQHLRDLTITSGIDIRV